LEGGLRRGCIPAAAAASGAGDSAGYQGTDGYPALRAERRMRPIVFNF
jgi:hypothetical protein